MRRIILIALLIKGLLFLWYLMSRNKNPQNEEVNDKDHEIDYDSLSNKLVNNSRLENCKSHYPFAKWRQKNTEYGMSQYTLENCETVELIFDELIADLKILTSEATAEDKVILFKYAVLTTNTINKRIDDLIETSEREDLCDLFDHITIAAGLEPEEFADGEGIADEWREW